VIVEFAIGGVFAAATIAFVLGYRAFWIPRPKKLEMPGGRWALLYRLAGGPRPTLIVLHSYSGDALTTAKYSGFLQAAIPRGFNVVVPEGIAREWHDTPDSSISDVDDIGFIASVAEKLIRAGIADPQRVFIAGISNGGMMAFAVVAARPDRFAGLGTISGGMPKHVFENFRLAKPMPLTMINGDGDDVLPYRGGNVGSRDGFFRSIAGVEATAILFAQANGCDTRTGSRRTPMRDGRRHIERIDWDCPPSAAVALIKVIGGGHDVIGWRPPLQAFLGLPPRGPATAAAIVAGFVEVNATAASGAARQNP
jgi:polyhydroxybutyrate depolymerase